jgi:hypothetical protein
VYPHSAILVPALPFSTRRSRPAMSANSEVSNAMDASYANLRDEKKDKKKDQKKDQKKDTPGREPKAPRVAPLGLDDEEDEQKDEPAREPEPAVIEALKFTVDSEGNADYPRELCIGLQDRYFTPDQLPQLREKYGHEIILMGRFDGELRMRTAPISMLTFSIFARSTKAVDAASLINALMRTEDIADSDAYSVLAAYARGDMPGGAVLVCAPPSPGPQAYALADSCASEENIFQIALQKVQALDLSGALGDAASVEALQLDKVLDMLYRYCEQEEALALARVREVEPPTGEWNIYSEGQIPEPDRLARAIKGYAAHTARVYPLSPPPRRSEVAALRALCQLLIDRGHYKRAEMIFSAAISSPGFTHLVREPGAMLFDITEKQLEQQLAGADSVQLSIPDGPQEWIITPEMRDIVSAMQAICAFLKGLKRNAFGGWFSAEDASRNVIIRQGYSDAIIAALEKATIYQSARPEYFDRSEVAQLETLWRNMGVIYNISKWHSPSFAKIENDIIEFRKRCTRSHCGLSPEKGYSSSNRNRTSLERLTELKGLNICAVGSAVKALESLYSDELTHAARREVVKKAGVHTGTVAKAVTPAQSFVLDYTALQALGIPNVVRTAEEVTARLDLYVGGFLKDLDLRKSFITGSAMAAVLINTEPYYQIGNRLLDGKNNLAVFERYIAEYYPPVYTVAQSREKYLGLLHHTYNALKAVNFGAKGMDAFLDFTGGKWPNVWRPHVKLTCTRGCETTYTCIMTQEIVNMPDGGRHAVCPTCGRNGMSEITAVHIGYLRSTGGKIDVSALERLVAEREAAVHMNAKAETSMNANAETSMNANAESKEDAETSMNAGGETSIDAEDTPQASAVCISLTAPCEGGFAAVMTACVGWMEVWKTKAGSFALEDFVAPDPVALRVVGGADTDIAIDTEDSMHADDEYDCIVQGHYKAIHAKYPFAKLKRVDLPSGRHNWSVYTDDAAHFPTFRCVEMYRARFSHIVTHHVAMVRAAYTAAFSPESPPTFVTSASFALSAAHLATPNYYYFASRKCFPQEVVLKYNQRGFSYKSFPKGLRKAIGVYGRMSDKWFGVEMGLNPSHTATGNYSAYALGTLEQFRGRHYHCGSEIYSDQKPAIELAAANAAAAAGAAPVQAAIEPADEPVAEPMAQEMAEPWLEA